MGRSRVSDLITITDAVYQKEYQQLRPLLLQEAQLTRQLAHLNDQVAEMRTQADATPGYQITGGDVVWHMWEAETRQNLNMQLARLRSQKLAALDNLRHAFGKKQAVANLAQQERDTIRKRALKRKAGS